MSPCQRLPTRLSKLAPVPEWPVRSPNNATSSGILATVGFSESALCAEIRCARSRSWFSISTARRVFPPPFEPTKIREVAGCMTKGVGPLGLRIVNSKGIGDQTLDCFAYHTRRTGALPTSLAEDQCASVNSSLDSFVPILFTVSIASFGVAAVDLIVRDEISLPRPEHITAPGIQHHWCVRPGCGKDAGWGFRSQSRRRIGSALSIAVRHTYEAEQCQPSNGQSILPRWTGSLPPMRSLRLAAGMREKQ